MNIVVFKLGVVLDDCRTATVASVNRVCLERCADYETRRVMKI